MVDLIIYDNLHNNIKEGDTLLLIGSTEGKLVIGELFEIEPMTGFQTGLLMLHIMLLYSSKATLAYPHDRTFHSGRIITIHALSLNNNTYHAFDVLKIDGRDVRPKIIMSKIKNHKFGEDDV